MPRCPYKGEVIWNSHLRRNMHAVATYDGGTKAIYSDMIHELGKIFRSNLSSDGQNIIVIEGQPGSGKSTLGITLARAIQKDWSLETGYIYDEKDLIRKMKINSTNQTFLFDEASLALNSRDSMTKSSRNILAILDTCRSRHNSLIFVLPSFDDLNKSVRDRLCQCRIFCCSKDDHIVAGYSSRGLFRVYFPRRAQFADPWWQLVGMGVFARLPDDLQQEYIAVKQQHQDEYIRTLTEEVDGE